MANTQMVSYKERYERLKGTLVRHREEAKASAEVMVESIEVAAGGAIAAILDTKMPMIPGTEIETKTVVGLGLSLVGLAEPFLKLGDVSKHLCSIGNGINAVNVYEQTKTMLAG